MERAGPVKRDEFYWAIMCVIPQRLVGEDLFSRKLSGKIWIHCERNKMVGQTSWEANFDNCERMLHHLVIYFTLVQFYGVTFIICALFRKHYYDKLLIFYAAKRTIILRRETVDP